MPSINDRIGSQNVIRVLSNASAPPSRLLNLTDVDSSSQTDGNLLIWDATDNKFFMSRTLDSTEGYEFSGGTNSVGIVTFSGSTQSESTVTGAVIVSGGFAVGKNVNFAAGLNVVGIATFSNEIDINAAVDILRGLNVSGITSVASLNIGATQVISSGRELQNIVSLDATTTATIEAAIEVAPNTFTDLKISGVSTFIGIATYAAGLQVVSGVSTFNDAVDINAGLDVDGQTDLDEVVIAGVTTFNNADVVFQGAAAGQNITFDASENDLEFSDDARLKFGNSDDLEIFHGTGNNSHIKNSTNDLKIRSDSLMLKRADDTESYLKATVNQDVKLYYNGDERFATTGIGITIVGVGSTAYIEGPDNIIIDPHPYGVGTTSGSVHIKGDLYVDGTEFIIDVDKIELGDFQIGIATTAGTNVLLDGAGIGIGSTNIRKFITWNNATSALMSSENWNLASGKHYEINGVDVLTSDTLQLLGTGAQVHAPSSNILTLKTNGAERLRIDATGNLGIGTVTPTDPANAANTTVTSAGIVTANQYYGTFLGSIPGFSTVFTSGQGSFSATPGSPYTIDTFAFASHDYEIAEYTLHFVHANGLQAQKTLVIQNNSTAYSNEYGILYDSELLVSIGATISGGNVNITATPETGISGVTTFRWRREVQT